MEAPRPYLRVLADHSYFYEFYDALDFSSRLQIFECGISTAAFAPNCTKVTRLVDWTMVHTIYSRYDERLSRNARLLI